MENPEEKKKVVSADVHRQHRARVKARMLREGLNGYEDHQLLEALLFYAQPRVDTNPTAHLLLERFGSLSAVLDAAPEELCQIHGIKENAALLLRLVAQFSKRYWTEQASGQDKRPVFLTTQALGEFLTAQFIGVNEEQLYLLCLDNRAKLLSFDLISKGSVNETQLNYRLIAQRVLHSKATGVVLSHNHPNASAQPSNDDVKATIFVRNSLAQLDVPLLDHIIVSGRQFTSMRQLEYL